MLPDLLGPVTMQLRPRLDSPPPDVDTDYGRFFVLESRSRSGANAHRRYKMFGIPKVQGVIFPKGDELQSDCIAVPFPGWLLRSAEFTGPAIARDFALWFTLVGITNSYYSSEEMSRNQKNSMKLESNLLSWRVPAYPLHHRAYHKHIDRLFEALRRLQRTTVSAKIDIINPQRKIKTPVPLLSFFNNDGDILEFKMDLSLVSRILKQQRYAHVNIKTLSSMRSIYGVRCYLMGLGYAAEGAWNKDGGGCDVLMDRRLFKSLIAPHSKHPMGIFKRDIIRAINKDLSRPQYANPDMGMTESDCVGAERMMLEIYWNQNELNDNDEPESNPSSAVCDRLKMIIRVHRSLRYRELIGDTRPVRIKDAALREQTFDLEQIKAERNKARSEGIKLGPARREWEKAHPGATLTKDGRVLYSIRLFGRPLPKAAAVHEIETSVDIANDLDHRRYWDEEQIEEKFFSEEEVDGYSDQDDDEDEDQVVAEDFSDMDREDAEEQARIWYASLEENINDNENDGKD